MWLLTPDPGQQLYVALFAVTLALHALLIGAVVGGTGYAVIAALRRTPDPIADVIRAWLPIGLGLAITAGVAPLLFVQVLYQDAFYTANLLRGPRWVAIVPALIAGFYLLYVHKRGWGPTRVHRAGVLALALGAFGFVAWSWSTNHRLMLDDAAWQLVYAHGEGAWSPVGRAARLATYAALSLPLLAVLASPLVARDALGAQRRLALLALVGTVGAGAGVAACLAAMRDGVDRSFVIESPWLPVLAIATAALLAAWTWRAWRPASRPALILAAVATGGVLLAGALVREAERASRLWALRPRVADAGGFPVFVVMAVVVIAAMIGIARIARAAR